MGWFSPSHCVDYFFQSVRLVRDHQTRGGKGCNAQRWRTRCAVDFCLSFFSNSMYRVTAREGTLLVILRSKRGTEGSFAPHFTPPSCILPMQALRLDFRATDGQVTPHHPSVARNARERVAVPAPTLCLAFRATEGFSCTHHPSLAPNKRQRARSAKACLPSQFSSDRGLFDSHTTPSPPRNARQRARSALHLNFRAVEGLFTHPLLEPCSNCETEGL